MIFEMKKKSGTRQVVPYQFRTPIPEFPSDMLLFNFSAMHIDFPVRIGRSFCWQRLLGGIFLKYLLGSVRYAIISFIFKFKGT